MARTPGGRDFGGLFWRVATIRTVWLGHVVKFNLIPGE